MAKNDHSSSAPLLEGDDAAGSRSPSRYRDDGDRIYEKPLPLRRSSRRVLSKQVIVGLVMLVIVFGIGAAVVGTGPDRVWTGAGSSSPAGSSGGKPASEISELPPSSRLMTQKEWADLDASKYDPKKFVLGAPTQKYRDNLRPDINYMAGWIAGGWTNDFMTYINLIYLALITRPRVPIVGQFHPTHVGEEAGYLHFGDVFDVPRMSKLIQMPVLEWRDIKNESSKEIEEVGCWSAWQVSGPDAAPRHSFIPEIVGLDISYTAAPKEIKISPDPWDWFIKFWPLAELAYPRGRHEALQSYQPQESVLHKAKHEPDTHMVCYDFLYFAGVTREDEWFWDYSPAWREVGTHTHWTPKIQQLTNGYLARHFEVTEDDIPPFIVVHVRRNDFGSMCGDLDFVECFAPLSDYAKRVEEVRAEIQERHGRVVDKVLVTSDERSKEWWDEVRKLGWSWLDHDKEETEKKYGKWYPVLIDAVTQGMANGFVGTDRSTMSMVAQRRVEDWQDGPTREVKWGFKGADAHEGNGAERSRRRRSYIPE